MERREFDGEWFISHEDLVVGDYGGAGMCGEANIRALESLEGAFIVNHAHHTRQLWLPDTEANRAIIEAFNDYPVFDDEVLCEVEADWEVEAWNSWLRSDLVLSLPEELRDAADWLDEQGKQRDDDLGDLFECYREAMEATNTYPAAEYSGVHVPVDRISHAFLGRVELAVFTHAWDQADRFRIAKDSPLCVLADALEEDGHLLTEAIRYLSEQVGNGV